MSIIASNPELRQSGFEKITWARDHMPLLDAVGARLKESRAVKGKTIAMSIHLEAKTANLALTLHRAGASVFATGSNPLSTQDDVCAALASEGVEVFARHGASAEEYTAHLKAALSSYPDIIIDDGGDLVELIEDHGIGRADRFIGGCEETTTGVLRLKARTRQDRLSFPMYNVNDAMCKHLFDNRYGTGQSVWDAILRTTNLNVAGSVVVVAGYGWCGKGVSMRAKGLGARVIVTEVDPVAAIEAVMDGFTVMPMAQAAPQGDFFITVTGCRDVIGPRVFSLLKDGAVLANAGHFDVEVEARLLRESAVRSWKARENIEGFEMPSGKKHYLLAEGRLVNLAAGNGHPVEIMDMSFALQALCVESLAQCGRGLTAGVHPVPAEIDRWVALRKLKSLGVDIDEWTDEQRQYVMGES
ncbi:MAG: adenosylhomocysteinase [Oscillospiraceae bacterium]|jgi:adenosylhomocysteinase|nr:adenosylhomocysteinase [Oscillospiraceae bacterium]